MKEIILLIIGLSISISSNAADVYGLDDQGANRIIKKYGKDLAEIETVLQKEIANHQISKKKGQSDDQIAKKRLLLIEKIKNENGFLFVDFETIFYPGDDVFFTTIEVIDKEQPERMRFVNSAIKNEHIEKKIVDKPDLIDAMVQYTNTGINLMVNHQIDFSTLACPVYHCTAGFMHPTLKPYLKTFNVGAIKNRAFIIETLNYDQDPERRAAAAFLVAHFHDPHEIVSLLSPHVADKDEGVRNNVMRVIGETIAKAKINNVNMEPFLDALDSPYTSDRNKALLVLLNGANSKASRDIILQKGSNRLIALMRLKQPNNHQTAYLILKKISGKDFGSGNLSAWNTWIYSARRELV